MLSPLWANSAQIDTFHYGNEDYIMMTFFFRSPPNQDGTWRPPIEFMPVTTIIMPRSAYTQIIAKFLGHIAKQNEPDKPAKPEEEKK